MDKLTVSIDIVSPVREVFSYVAEQRNYTSWRPELSSCELTSGGLMEVGATRPMTRSEMGMHFNWEFVCHEHDPPSRMVRHSDNDHRMRMIDMLDFAEESGGARVVHHLDME